MAEPLLRALHILFGVLWAGGALYRSLIVERIMRRDPGHKAAFFAQSLHGPYMGITALGTVAFGTLALLGGSYKKADLGSGFFLFHGALGLAMLAFAMGLFLQMPNDIRLKRLAQARAHGPLDEPDQARYARLERREALYGRAATLLILGAVFGMAFFRAFA